MDTMLLAPWLTKENLAYDFELKEETPSLNVIKQMHWMQYRQLRQMWRVRVLCHALSGRLPDSPPLERAALVIERHCAGMLDWDNAYGGLKPLLDCLVCSSQKNPQGLGLIRDDNPKSMPYPPILLQLKAAKKQGRTRVQIYSL